MGVGTAAAAGVIPPAACLGDAACYESCTQCVKCVITSRHALVVVHVGDSPVLVLPMVDHIADDAAPLAAATVAACVAQRHDAAGVSDLWGLRTHAIATTSSSSRDGNSRNSKSNINSIAEDFTGARILQPQLLGLQYRPQPFHCAVSLRT